MTTSRKLVAWPVVLIAGFLLPGSGHFLYGERKRGILIGAVVLLTFGLGVLIGGVRVITMPDFSIPNVSLLAKIFSEVAFIPQFFAGPVTVVCGLIGQGLASDPETSDLISHARVYDLGLLYTGVAGGLNLLSLVDITARAASKTLPRDGREAPANGGAQ